MGLFGGFSYIAPLLFANPATRIVDQTKGLIRDLNTADPINIKYSPTITFSFVPPPPPTIIEDKEESTENQSHELDSDNQPHVKVWKPSNNGIDTTNFNEDELETNHNSDLLFEKIREKQGKKPIAIFLPGLDGIGISATNQFDDLSKSYELWRLIIDTSDRTSFRALTDHVVKFVNDVGKNGRDVIIIGESFGGLLAPSAVLQTKKKLNNKGDNGANIKGMVLVNPATSFGDTQWANIVPVLSSLRTLEDRRVFNNNGNLPSLYSIVGGITLAATIPDRKQLQWIVDTILETKVTTVQELEQVLIAMRDGFDILEERIPADTLEFRVTKWLPLGTSYVNPRLSLLKNVPTVVIGGDDDNLLPTKDEAKRLVQEIPNCTNVLIQDAGHFVLTDRVNLTKIIEKSHITTGPKNERKKDLITEWEKPSKKLIEKTLKDRVTPFRRAVSPIFISTDNNGKRHMGLSHLPSTAKDDEKPIVFVANHQFGGLDLGLIIAELIEQRDIYARGLAHPIIFQGGSQFGNGGGGRPTQTQARSEDISTDEEDYDDGEGYFQKFGAVMVTPRNYYRLMQTNQTALLFPGGVREVFHGKNEAYQLFWPEKADFVRTAAKFNATIIPLSAVGAADSVNILIDAPDMLKLPYIGERIANTSASVMAARFDSSGNNSSELFAAPFALPKLPPARHYFVFGKPMNTENLNAKDKDACDVFYKEVKNEMMRGFDDILEAREKDPYGDSVVRIAYESVAGKKAPTFSIDEIN